LSPPPNGSKDDQLYIRDLPNITVGDWQQAPKGTADNPIVILDDVGDSIEVDVEDGLLYTTQEVAEGITIKEEKEEDITIDSGDESEAQFDYDS
jgi:hypothetical protein